MNPEIIQVQLTGILAAFLWAFPTAWILFRGLSALTALRVETIDEQRGLDYVEHYELGYPEFQHSLLHRGKE